MAKKVLVVEDSEYILKIMVFMLKKMGYEVVGVEDGQKAIDTIRTQTFDLVFLDLNLPIVNGPEVCKIIKSDETLKKIPVIFLSASSDDVLQNEIVASGANGYAKKPFEAEDIKAVLTKYLG